MTGSAFLRTQFEISSGPGALFSASQPTAYRSCCIVTWGSYGTSFGYLAEGLSARFASDGSGKNEFQNAATFCSFDAAWPLRVGTNFDIGVAVMYLLTCHMVFLSALFT